MKTDRPDRPSRPQGAGVSRGARRLLHWLAQGRDLGHIARRLGRDEQRLKEKLAELLARLGVDTPQAALDKLRAGHAVPGEPDGFEDIDEGGDDGSDDAADDDATADAFANTATK